MHFLKSIGMIITRPNASLEQLSKTWTTQNIIYGTMSTFVEIETVQKDP